MAVRPVRGQDVDPLAAMLARAFHDDPVTAWFYAARPRPPAVRGALLRLAAAAPARRRSRCTSPTTGSGAALWALPGRWRESTWQALRLFAR